MSFYQIGLLGDATPEQVQTLKEEIVRLVTPLGVVAELDFSLPDASFTPRADYSSVAILFGGDCSTLDPAYLQSLMRQGTPIIPVVGDLTSFAKLVPACLHHINGLQLDPADKELTRIATAALECMGLLPRQRRIFLSYRRTEARDTAVQLFEHLTSRHFDVFLDTHGVAPAEDFQEVLWHRLSDSDVLVMLDTPTYFKNRWTNEEFGRALAKSLSPVRLGWPGVAPASRSFAAESIQLEASDFQPDANILNVDALARATIAIERVRSRGIAVRGLELTSAVAKGVEKIDGKFLGLGPKRTIVAELASGHKVLVFPSVGVPTSEHLHQIAVLNATSDSRAVVYDDAGVGRQWQTHLEWLGQEIKSVKWLKMGRVPWELGAWPQEYR